MKSAAVAAAAVVVAVAVAAAVVAVVVVVVVVVVVAVATAVLLGAMSRAQRISSNYRGYTAVGFYAGSGHWDIGEQGTGDAVICMYSSKNKTGKEICIFVKNHQVDGNVYYSQSHAFAPAPSTPSTPLTSGFLDSCSSGIPAATVQIDEVEGSAQHEVRVAPPLIPLASLGRAPTTPPPVRTQQPPISIPLRSGTSGSRRREPGGH